MTRIRSTCRIARTRLAAAALGAAALVAAWPASVHAQAAPRARAAAPIPAPAQTPAAVQSPAATQTPPAAWASAGPGVDYQPIAVWDTARLDRVTGTELDAFMASSTLPTAFRGRFPEARNAVALYRVRYASVVPEQDGRPTVATGLVAVPLAGGVPIADRPLPMVSYQHGTVFDASFVPSNPESSMETRLVLARFAAHGHVVIGADYFGRGGSSLPDSYLVKRSTQQATQDMLLASHAVLAALGVRTDRLFLSGWSQGGWATMAFLQALETAGVPVAAAAAASAPMDVAVTVGRWIGNPVPGDAPYLPGVVAIQLQAQEHYAGVPGLAESAIRPEYLQAARDLYRGRIDFETFFARTPPTLERFVRPEFARSLATGTAPYVRLLEASQAYRWRSTTPVRTYVGGADEVTPVAIGRLPELVQPLLGGAPARAVDAGARADHRGVFVHGLLDQKDWFESMPAR